MSSRSPGPNGRPRVSLIKLGGSLITHKTGFCRPNTVAIDRFGTEIAALLRRPAVRVVVTLGGGSFGNQLPVRFKLLDRSTRRTVDIPRMTVGMQRWAGIVCERWWQLGIPAHPFQLAAMLMRVGADYVYDLRPIVAAVRAGLVPLIAGDLLMHPRGRGEIFSSDRIGELLPRHFRVRRAVMLTDVEGVKHQGSVLGRIDRKNYGQVIASCGPSSKPDVTGGMLTKVSALWRLAEAGVPGVVCDGRVPGNLQRAVLARIPPGTRVVANGK
jgi:isopentenyl phosphate kinase